MKQGDFVTIGLPNSIEFYEATVATWKLGAVPQPVSARLPARERQAIVDLAQPAIVVGADQADHPGHVCIPAGFTPDSALADDPLPDAVAPSWKAPTSGGSTGRPKLIVAGQEGKLDPDLLSLVFRMERDDTHLVPGPLYHNAPFSLSTVGLFMGHHLVVLPKFDAEVALAAIDEHRVQWMNLVPTMMLRMHRAVQADPDRYDLSSLRVVWHMAAPCPEWLKEAWIELVGPDTLMELYGGTEGQASTIITGTEWLAHRGSVGKPLTGQMKVLDPDGNPVPAGEIGEIYMRPFDGMAPTYHYIGAEARELDGWESLGDLGWMDEEGYVYLSDRRTDLILSGGANIYPAEVEAAIDEHPERPLVARRRHPRRGSRATCARDRPTRRRRHDRRPPRPSPGTAGALQDPAVVRVRRRAAARRRRQGAPHRRARCGSREVARCLSSRRSTCSPRVSGARSRSTDPTSSTRCLPRRCGRSPTQRAGSIVIPW